MIKRVRGDVVPRKLLLVRQVIKEFKKDVEMDSMEAMEALLIKCKIRDLQNFVPDYVEGDE